jgi:hypothetical protein
MCREPITHTFKLSRKIKKSYAKKIKSQIDISKNRRRDVIERYDYYKLLNLEFEFLTQLFEVAIKLPPYPDDSDTDDAFEDTYDDDSDSGLITHYRNGTYTYTFSDEETTHRIRSRTRLEPYEIMEMAYME